MRLEKIKLAGFKSFVDPTTVSFPSNRVGVVGPNGCGKSNVIDAVRWVMGESSAKLLRGESMADVIFNGSGSRKPVGTAGIELLFDNSDGSAGGEMARFAQIAVKRQVSRDGQSAYFLNGSRCRRRDIQDLFLGTGLGPRSYAIIEQGTISRFVEAKPDELRLFIEEAAGISRYKERRRETENRMRHTRENLERLEDLRDEVAKHLEHLERQAAAAEKYRALQEDERRLGDELAALQWRALDAEVERRDRVIGETEVALESETVELRRLEAEIEAQRAAHAEAAEAFNAVQGRWYALGAEIARLEQAIRFARENHARQERELGQVRGDLDAALEEQRRDRERLAELDAALAADAPRQEAARERVETVRERLADAEERLEAWQASWDEVQAQAAEPTGRAEQERGAIDHLEQRLAEDAQRSAGAAEELARLDTAELEARIEQLEARSAGLDERLHHAADAQARATEALRSADEARQALAARLDAARTELQTLRGRQSSLEALQDAALADGDGTSAEWLVEQGLDDRARLLDLLQVAPGWEGAVEAVLGPALAALCVNELEPLVTGLQERALMLVEHDAVRRDWVGAAPAGDAGLAALVSGPAVLRGLLAGVATAEDAGEALQRRSGLRSGERIVTRDGLLVGADWVRSPGHGRAAQAGVDGSIARAEELRRLQASIEELEAAIAELDAEQERASARRPELERARDEAQATLTQLSRDRAALDAEQGAAQARLSHLRERRERLEAERAQLEARRSEIETRCEEARARLRAALEVSERLAARRDELAAERDARRREVGELRSQESALRDELQGLEVAAERRGAERAALAAALERAETARAGLSERRDQLLGELSAGEAPAAEQQERLDEQLELRSGIEQELAATRERMERIDSEIRAAEQRRHGLERRSGEARQRLDDARLQRQETLVRRRTLEEQLSERGRQAPAVLAQMDAGESAGEDAPERWQQALERVRARITRLGNINLAAIDEYQEQSERMRYLEAQHADIGQSLETLEMAIRKIDRETRARFKETFEQLNAGLGELFPRVFGGGHAYLELIGDDLLDTGVAIMARPPGKRNSNIHMLSGGEKALTAVALVFAIFQLNPAPFCMLDEVDAPLDDANVGRFCELVRSMSDRIQFIFITHNKATMELADQLLGITMQEAGVSRLVSVDVDEASRMAAIS